MLGWYDGDGLGAVVLLVLLVVLIAGAMVSLLLVLVRSSTGDPRHEAPHVPAPRSPWGADATDEVDEGQFVHAADRPGEPSAR